MHTKILSERVFRAGYVVRRELWQVTASEKPTEMTAAYTPSGDYIGSPKDARFLCVKRGIVPIKRDPAHCVCSIGYAPAEKKWYGWSHRAIHGFGVGDTVKKGHVTDGVLPVGFKAKTLADAKRMAEAFASGVS